MIIPLHHSLHEPVVRCSEDRYCGRRLEKLERGGARDGDEIRQLRPLWERYLARLSRHRQRGHIDTGLEGYRWLLEELRISLFAQELGVRERISRQRLDALWQQITP